MGLLRLLLAVSVLISHSNSILGLGLVEGSVAVPAFFIISGFYMSLILNEKYIQKNSYKLFIKNRLLKLFPPYWIVLSLTILISLIYLVIFKKGYFLQPWLEYFNSISTFPRVLLTVVNFLIVGQESTLFLQLDHAGSLQFSRDFTKANPHLYDFLFVPQAWTLSAELIFYSIAPLLVRRNLLITLSIMAGSLFLRFFILSAGLNYDPWVHRFFPTQLLFFLAGSVAYKIYRATRNDNTIKMYSTVAFVFVSVFTISYSFIPGSDVKNWIYYINLTLLIPFIFNYSKHQKADRFLGELSYPIYISHLLIIGLIERLFNAISGITHISVDSLRGMTGILSLFCSIAFSILLIRLVINPIEQYRQNSVKKLLA